MKRADRTIRTLISGSAALYTAARQAAAQRGETLSGWIAGAVRARLAHEGQEVPAPTPMGPRRGPLSAIPGVGSQTELVLERAGYTSLDELLRDDVDQIAARTGLGARKAGSVLRAARGIAREL